MREATATIDFETRSACSLKLSGSWRYSLDPTTEVLCLAYGLPYWPKGRVELWHPANACGPEEGADDNLTELLDWIAAGEPIEAHNAAFERAIWGNILVARHGWPAIAISQWRCSAAKAAAHALPRGLDEALSALRLKIRKDVPGSKVMMKMSKPRKPRKAEREADVTGLLWWESADLFAQLFAYCRQDILAEEALSAALPDLSPSEQALYTLDQIINERGFQLDTEAVSTALSLIESETTVLNSELSVLTGGRVKKATQRAQMIQWFSTVGLELDNTQKGTLDDIVLQDDLGPEARRGVEIVRALGRSSTAKYQSMIDHMDDAGRVRDGLLFHGASTGRWSGKGVQPHNFPRGTVKDQELLWEVLKTRDRGFIGAEYSSVMEALSNALRGAIVPSEGHQLFVADYAGIEARVVQWLARDEEALEVFRQGGDVYKDMAADIYHVPVAEVTKDQRQLGKVAILGCGFGMGWSKFVSTCTDVWKIPIEDDMAQQVVAAYRAKFWRLADEWKAQEYAAIKAVGQKGKPVECGRTTWIREGNFLYCILPSGRRLAYPFPEIRLRQTPWGEEKAALTFMGINTYTRKWERQHTYGGSLVENIVQAIARDLLANSMTLLEQRDYGIVLSVHDETICDVPMGRGSLAEFTEIMSTVPAWGEGCPIGVESWVGTRYKK